MHIGLRGKIVAVLMGVVLAVAASALALLEHQRERDALISERSEAIKDLQRLLLSLDQQVAVVDSILGSWSNFTEFYEHAKRPDPEFSRTELSVESLRFAHFDWLLLFDEAHQLVESAEVPNAEGIKPLTAAIKANNSEFSAKVDASVRQHAQQCGIGRVADLIAFTCFRPLLRSDGQGPSRGKVMIGRWLTPKLLDQVRAETNLSFEIEKVPQVMIDPRRPLSINAKVASGVPEIVEHETHLDISLPVTSLANFEVARLTLHWPRESRARLVASQQQVRTVVLVMALLTGLLLAALIDRLVITRVNRFNHELGRGVDSQDWKGSLTVDGHDEFAQMTQRANHVLETVRTTLTELRSLSLRDTLTGLANRRRFDDALTLMLRQFRRDGQVGVLVIFDVDHFKRYNDHYGHPAGDAALIAVAEALLAGARRPDDVAARLGGEEFALLLPRTPRSSAEPSIAQVLQALATRAIVHEGNPPYGVLTLSGGCAELRPEDSVETLYARADAALYRAKHSGRNRVEMDSSLVLPLPEVPN